MDKFNIAYLCVHMCFFTLHVLLYAHVYLFVHVNVSEYVHLHIL